MFPPSGLFIRSVCVFDNPQKVKATSQIWDAESQLCWKRVELWRNREQPNFMFPVFLILTVCKYLSIIGVWTFGQLHWWTGRTRFRVVFWAGVKNCWKSAVTSALYSILCIFMLTIISLNFLLCQLERYTTNDVQHSQDLFMFDKTTNPRWR